MKLKAWQEQRNKPYAINDKMCHQTHDQLEKLWESWVVHQQLHLPGVEYVLYIGRTNTSL